MQNNQSEMKEEKFANEFHSLGLNSEPMQAKET